MVEQELIHLQDRFDLTLISERMLRAIPDGVSAVELSPWRPFPATNPALRALLRRFDLVHCHDSLGMMVAARAAGKRFLVTSHGIAPIRLRPTTRSKVEGRITLAAYPSLYRSADVVVAISRYVATWVKEFAKVDAQFIPNGVAGVMPSISSRPTERKLLYVGEISKRKGVADLIDGLQASPKDVSLDLVGRASPPSYWSDASRSKLSDRIRFHGILEPADLAHAYASAFCTCSASFWEGFGLPVLEGFSFGRPSVVRGQGGMLEQVEESGAGCCFQTPSEMAACIDVVTENWEEFSKRGREFASIHTWRETFRAYGDLFQRLLH
ncbi:MAG: glycosyltransferase family 4 protein [Chloroflexi bacterium]|nr:MAG: glycosyltransferase family 4 protein [Chloroflexota bacterium]